LPGRAVTVTRTAQAGLVAEIVSAGPRVVRRLRLLPPRPGVHRPARTLR
jgi:hypothetical protein